MKSKKVIVIVSIIAVLLLAVVASVFAVNSHNKKVEAKEINTKTASIEKTYDEFNKETDRAKKLNILKDFEAKEKEYSEKEKVKKSYDNNLSKMIKFFIEDYNKTLKDNTISEDEVKKFTNENKGDLNKYIENLTKLVETITSEEKYVFIKNDNIKYEKSFDDYNENANKLINTYKNKITSIDKEEESKRIAAEEESKRIAAEEESKRIAAEEESKRIAAEAESRRIAAAEEAERQRQAKTEAPAIETPAPEQHYEETQALESFPEPVSEEAQAPAPVPQDNHYHDHSSWTDVYGYKGDFCGRRYADHCIEEPDGTWYNYWDSPYYDYYDEDTNTLFY